MNHNVESNRYKFSSKGSNLNLVKTEGGEGVVGVCKSLPHCLPPWEEEEFSQM